MRGNPIVICVRFNRRFKVVPFLDVPCRFVASLSERRDLRRLQHTIPYMYLSDVVIIRYFAGKVATDMNDSITG